MIQNQSGANERARATDWREETTTGRHTECILSESESNQVEGARTQHERGGERTKHSYCNCAAHMWCTVVAPR